MKSITRARQSSNFGPSYLAPFQRYCRFFCAQDPIKFHSWPYYTLILGVFPLDQIAHAWVNLNRYLKLFFREIIFESIPTCVKNICDGRTDTVDVLWHHRDQWLPAPPILPTDRHCARYKFLYCIVLCISTTATISGALQVHYNVSWQQTTGNYYKSCARAAQRSVWRR